LLCRRARRGSAFRVQAFPDAGRKGRPQEALKNIQDAIREYLAAVEESLKKDEVREVEVAV